MRHYQRLDRLASWIRSSTTPQAARARYRSALRRDYIETDSDYATIADARDSALARIADQPAPAPRPATLCDDTGTPLSDVAESIPPGHVLLTSGRVIESAHDDHA